MPLALLSLQGDVGMLQPGVEPSIPDASPGQDRGWLPLLLAILAAPGQLWLRDRQLGQSPQPCSDVVRNKCKASTRSLPGLSHYRLYIPSAVHYSGY